MDTDLLENRLHFSPDLGDPELAMLVKNEADNDALSTLISRHSGICYKIYNKYLQSNTTTSALDVADQKDSLIYQAAKTYDPNHGTKFSTWLGNIVTYACLNVCSEKRREIPVDSQIIQKLSESSSIGATDMNTDGELFDYIKKIIDMCADDAEKEVVKLRYLSGDRKVKTFKEIAETLGVSTQTVVNWHDKFINFLKNKLQSKDIFDIV
jgi:RNA polymerase sigma factor (sigma-70 family)